MTFTYDLDPHGEPTIVEEKRGISVVWESGLGRRPEQHEIGGIWRFEHADWKFTVTVEGELFDAAWAPGKDGDLVEVYGSAPRISLHTYAKPKRNLGDVVPHDINQIIADAMITIYSKGGRFPGRIEYSGPYGLKREYASNN